jgi:hypothetical protein
MWLHFINLLHRSWHLFLIGQGTTALGFMSPYIVSFFAVIVAGLLVLHVRGKSAMIQHWKQSLGIVFGAALIGNVLWFGSIFSWDLVKTVYEDHDALVSMIPMARRDQESLDRKTIDSLNGEIEKLKNRQPPVKEQCWMQTATLPAPKDVPTAESTSEAIAFCNTERKAPLFMDVEYNEAPMLAGRILFPQSRQVSMEEMLEDNHIRAKIESPSILPYQIFIVLAYGARQKAPLATKIQIHPINPEH